MKRDRADALGNEAFTDEYIQERADAGMLAKFTVADLTKICKFKGVTLFSKKKADIIQALNSVLIIKPQK